MTLSLAIILASASTGPQPPMAPLSAEYLVQCAMGRSFRFTADARQALVEIGARKMILARTDLPLGEYFRGKDCALIIDGDFVAFVPRGDERWRDCHLMP